MSNPMTEILNSLKKKDKLLDRIFIESNYNTYVVAHILSCHVEYMPVLEYLNSRKLNNYNHYLFLYYMLPQNFNYVKMESYKASHDDVLSVIEKFANEGVSYAIARQYIDNDLI